MSWRDFSPVAEAENPIGFGDWRHAKGQSTVAYDPPGRRNKCIGKDHTCNGFRTKDSKHCAGHLNAMKVK